MTSPQVKRAWKPGRKLATVGDLTDWRKLKKAQFTRNINRAVTLRRARMYAEVTQREVGEALGISGSGYNYWENGHRILNDSLLRKALRAIESIAKTE